MTILRREIYIIDNIYVKILDIENVNGRGKFFCMCLNFKKKGKRQQMNFVYLVWFIDY